MRAHYLKFRGTLQDTSAYPKAGLAAITSEYEDLIDSKRQLAYNAFWEAYEAKTGNQDLRDVVFKEMRTEVKRLHAGEQWKGGEAKPLGKAQRADASKWGKLDEISKNVKELCEARKRADEFVKGVDDEVCVRTDVTYGSPMYR